MARFQNIGRTIKYQKNSVVSREIFHQPRGTVTLFAFDKGQGLSEHSAPFSAYISVLDGFAEITVSGETHKVKSGKMLLISPNSPHSLRATRPFKMMLTMVKQ